MNWLDGVQLGITLLLSLLAKLKPGTAGADAKVASEINAAIDALNRARSVAIDAPELESLRTAPLW